MANSPTFNINTYGVGMGVITSGAENEPQLNINDNWMVENFFPIGTIHLTVDPTNPSEYFGGIWERFGLGRTLVCVDENDETELFSQALSKGGEKKHKLVTAELPSHRHRHSNQGNDFSSGSSRRAAAAFSGTIRYTSLATGGNQPHNNLQPYITCYMWVRIA